MLWFILAVRKDDFRFNLPSSLLPTLPPTQSQQLHGQEDPSPRSQRSHFSSVWAEAWMRGLMVTSCLVGFQQHQGFLTMSRMDGARTGRALEGAFRVWQMARLIFRLSFQQRLQLPRESVYSERLYAKGISVLLTVWITLLWTDPRWTDGKRIVCPWRGKVSLFMEPSDQTLDKSTVEHPLHFS